MATATVPQAINFTRDDLNAVANTAIIKAGTDKPLYNAIQRALGNLSSGRFSYDGHQVILHSASGEGVYRIDTKEPMRCSCKGRARGYKCWHIVAARLIVRAAEHHARRPKDVYWRYNPETKQVDIIGDGAILESTTLGNAAARITFHRAA